MSEVIPISLLPFLIMLAISPAIGYGLLRMLYPDVRICMSAKKIILSLIAGFGAYFPASFVGLLMFIRPNLMYFAMAYMVSLIVDASVIKYARDHRAITVGIPTNFIEYGFKVEKQRVEDIIEKKRDEKIDKLTNALEDSVKDKVEVRRALERLKDSLKERKTAKPGETKKIIEEMHTQLDHKAEIESVYEERADKAEKLLKLLRDETIVSPKIKLEKPAGKKKVERITDNIRKELKDREDIHQSLDNLKAALLEAREKEKAEKLFDELETKVKESRKVAKEERVVNLTGVAEKDERAKKLLQALEIELKKKEIGQKRKTEFLTRTETVEETEDGDMKKLVDSLKSIKGSFAEEKQVIGGVHEEWKDELARKVGEERARVQTRGVRGADDDLFKGMVNDVRAQLILFKRSETGKRDEIKKEPEPGKKWYEEKQAKAEEPKKEVDLFESEISFGDLGGSEPSATDLSLEDLTLGVGDENLLELEAPSDIDTQTLSNIDYDGMFVDIGKKKGGCPRCGKNGTTLVFCPMCAHGFCSNCAKNVTAKGDSIAYTCPNCGNQFAMMRRV